MLEASEDLFSIKLVEENFTFYEFLPSCDMEEKPPHQPLAEEEPWTEVQSRKRRRMLNRSSSSELSNTRDSTLINVDAAPTPTTTQLARTLNRFRISCSDPQGSYELLRTLEKAKPQLNMVARPNLAGLWILTPKDHATYKLLKEQIIVRLEELLPEERTQKALVKGYHKELNLDHLLQLPNVLEAIRQKASNGSTTKNVITTFKGPIPNKVDLGIWGKFATAPFTPSPLRCRNCQRFGHHKSRCTKPQRCGVCSGRHPSEVCIQKHQQGETTRARCPNCRRNHHAWNPNCPKRLERMPSQKPNQNPPKRTPPTSTATKPQQRPPAKKEAPKPPSNQAAAKRQTAKPPKQQPARPTPQRKEPAPPHQAPTMVRTEAPAPSTNRRWEVSHQNPQGFWERPAKAAPVETAASRTSSVKAANPQNTITITEESLKAMLLAFAGSLAGMLGVQLDNNQVQCNLNMLIQQAKGSSNPPNIPAPVPQTPQRPAPSQLVTSTPIKQRVPVDVSLSLVNLPEEIDAINPDNFPALEHRNQTK